MNGFNPQWQFGYGLSYTSFGYSNFTLSTDTINTNYSIKGEVTVTNTGKYAGKEVVQLYIRDVVASITPDDRKLVGFEKISLNPGQSAKVSFTVSFNDLKFVGLNNKWIAEEGDFELLIGGNPSDMVKKSFYYKTSK